MSIVTVCASLLTAAVGAWAGAIILPEKPMKGAKGVLCIALCLLCGTLCGAFMQETIAALSDLLRLIVAVGCLAGAACCDLAEHRIPNLFSLVMLIAFAISSVFDMLSEQGVGLEVLLGGLLGGAVIFLLLYVFRGLCRLIFHQSGVGWGDIKLLSALACLIGLYGAFSVLVFGQIAALLTAVILLVTRKVSIKDGIPFAPFLYFGLCATAAFSAF